MLLSVVVPCYNEKDNVKPFYETASNVLRDMTSDYEIIFVNDGSSDGTFNELTEIYNQNQDNVKAINFSRNFGKEAALLAGLESSTGDYVAVIDADLQQNPKYIKEMYEILQNNPEYDGVAAYQDIRNESKVLSLFKDLFYKLINKFTEIKLFRSASDFRLLKRNVVDAIITLPEKSRFSKGIFSWVGFNTYYMPYRVEERNSGISKWSFWKLTRYAVDGIVSFSNKPLLFSLIVSVILAVISAIFLLVSAIRYFAFALNVTLPVIIGIIFLTSALQMLGLGIIGEYFSKMYTEIKGRPMYIVKSRLEKEEKR